VSTKIYTLVDGLGNPVRFILTGGNRHDLTEAPNLLKDLQVGAVIADKAFDSGDLLKLIAGMQAQAIIPPRVTTRQPRPFDPHRYQARNVIERFFARIKQFRRIATRYDKLATRYGAFISIVAAYIWLA
jgi:transposase